MVLKSDSECCANEGLRLDKTITQRRRYKILHYYSVRITLQNEVF